MVCSRLQLKNIMIALTTTIQIELKTNTAVEPHPAAFSAGTGSGVSGLGVSSRGLFMEIQSETAVLIHQVTIHSDFSTLPQIANHVPVDG